MSFCPSVIIFIILIVQFSECNSYNLLPNVLFIVVDDLRPVLGCYGEINAYTPNIDALAHKSILFKNAYAQQALCAPSRNSFLTSRRPDNLHLYDFSSYWRDTVGNFTTLPQFFKESGYYTYSIGKVFHPNETSNWTDDYPYSWSEKAFHPSTEVYKDAPVCLDNKGRRKNLICPVDVEFQPEQTLPDLQSLEEAKRFLNEQKNSVNPYFLAVGFHKPHIPLKYPRKYLDFHPLDNITLNYNLDHPYQLPSVAWNPWVDIRRRADIKDLNISFPYGKMPVDWTKKIVQNYEAAVTYIDDLIGQLLSEIDEKETIVVLIGDHGWSLGEHGEWSKYSNYDVATRVPFILYVPNEKPKIINTSVELLDIFPTLVDFANLEPTLPKCNFNQRILCTDGESLRKLITHKKHYSENKYAFSQFPRPGIVPTQNPNSDKPHLKDIKMMGYSVVGNNYRYTEWVHFNNTNFQPNWNQLVGAELYSHEFDRGENINLIDRPELLNIRQFYSKLLRKHTQIQSF